ncbi:hypothetical protein GMDG_06629 [Pseudogymnoascus destructans 20631-21]|uniref:C3H1-type domain-containing protein n=1 Tax=Pseudogymnoascus destructans (strain ATCC MYA-4855 / 20631-21) TaxID=658429 RepID=L8FUK1_PSED2|nr:hypothetical protein GMDG_06629 [Pseudogymnoascus destructans 20631-21]
MSVAIPNESITAALNDAIQPKLAEIGWSTGGADDSALAEYIILMLANGKTQDQIAAELSGDLLNLGPDDPGAKEFAHWLFEQVAHLTQQQNGGAVHQNGVPRAEAAEGGNDEVMEDASEAGDPNVPTGPKSMRTGGAGMSRGRDRRMLGQLQKNLDGKDSVLHRVRAHGGNERIGARGAPTGPRGNMQQRAGRFGAMGGMQGGPAGVNMITPAQQMEMFHMMQQMFTPEQHASMRAGNGGQMPMGGMPPYQQQQQGRNAGRSLFDRVQPSRGQRQQQFNNRTPFQQHQQQQHHHQQQQQAAPVSPMDMVLTPAHELASPDTTCKFSLTCTNSACKFAHQSPAAPPGTTIDVTDSCAFGAACKNRKCTARHPSPAQKVSHNAEQDCKFFPNCTNGRCPFRHPTAPLCRNGADCRGEGCKFTHVKTMCKFNPCLNPQCAFRHEEGQRRGKFEDKVWVAGDEGKHVSERKFVDESGQVEELIVPGNTGGGMRSWRLSGGMDESGEGVRRGGGGRY